MSKVKNNERAIKNIVDPEHPFFTNKGVIDEPIDITRAFGGIPEAWDSFDIVYSLDAETQSYSDDMGNPRNKVLSYQIGALNIKKGTYRECIVFPENGKRLRLRDIISNAIGLAGLGRTKADGVNVLQLTHYGIMEWSLFQDRKDVSSLFKEVHKVPVCFRSKEIKSVPLKGSHYVKVLFRSCDTYLHAPAGFRGLDKLSGMTLTKKVSIGGWIKDMEGLLRDNRDLFIHYALSDIRATLEYEALFLHKVSLMTGTPCLPVTLGDLSVKCFDSMIRDMNNIPKTPILKIIDNEPLLRLMGKEITSYTDSRGHSRKSYKYTDKYSWNKTLCSDSYYGGLNISFICGERKAAPGKVFLDLDFCGAYPTALAACGDIDFNAVSVRFNEIQVRTVDELLKYLKMDLCDISEVPHYYFCLDFKWAPDTLFPSIPCHTDAGLIYPLEGYTYCTMPELLYALSTGKLSVTINAYTGFKSKRDAFTLAGVFKKLTEERKKSVKGTLEERMWKEVSNTLYGKMAQGIKERKVFDITRNESRTLGPSPISCVYYASSCTGLVRAALSSAIDVIGNAGDCEVICATTDGFIAEVPLPEGFEIKTDDNGIVVPPSIEELLEPALLKRLESSYPIHLMIKARHKMGCENWLEIKHVGNEVGSYKTRVNWLTWDGVQQCKAASGMQVDDYNKIREIAASDKLVPIQKKRLPSMREILDGKVFDLISLITTQKASLAPDGKRVYSQDGLSSLPPATVSDVLKTRAVIKHRKKDLGEVVKPKDLHLLISCAKNNVKVPKKNGLFRVTEMMVLRVIARMDKKRYFGGRSHKAVAALLGLKDLKNYKRQAPVFGCIPDCEESRKVIRDIALKVGLSCNENEFEKLLFPIEQSGSSMEIPPALDPSPENCINEEGSSSDDGVEFEGLLFPLEQTDSSMEIPVAVDPYPENYIDDDDWSWNNESVIDEEENDASVAV
jgi:hypothetical protein